ncbi:MAG: 4Fe-4S binding protein [Acidobacteria bacterium]|nr:4Fe-4S binding protein [Acidobacteriota bacterium]
MAADAAPPRALRQDSITGPPDSESTPGRRRPDAGLPGARKKLLRRAGRNRAQTVRRTVQLAFFALNVWIAVEFYLFVRYYETGGRTIFAARPSGVEGWLPIASLMNLKVLLYTGRVPAMHPAGMFLLLAFLAASWIFRKSFCGWLCPIGTLSEYLWRLGRQTFGRNFRLPRWLDIALRSLKYILLALFVYAVASMSVSGIRAFLEGPYGEVADVKMLNFFRDIGLTGGIVLAVLIVGSVFVQNLWCRYLCPYGALMGLASLASPLRIRRDPGLCIDCARCAKACPSALPVDRLITIQSAECIGCMECVTSCPAEGALFMSAPRRKRVPAWAIAAGIAVLFFGAVGYARWTGHWRTDLPSQTYFELVPHANEFTHPG